MELAAQAIDELALVEINLESTLQRLYHLRRRRNFLASPLLRLPTELILRIFEHAVELGDEDDDSPSSMQACRTLLVIVGICYELRKIGMTTHYLWSIIDLTTPSLAELFLERCNYDPRILIKSLPLHEGRETLWTQLQARTFNSLRSLVFKGGPSEFTDGSIPIPILQWATNLSSLDIHFVGAYEPQLPWYLDTPIPSLSVLRLRGFSIRWTSPLLRNLSRLTLDAGPAHNPVQLEHTPIETFLTALASCPDLELLELRNAGPKKLNGHRDNCDMVVQLHKLRRLSLHFQCPSAVGYILSHIGYPESVRAKITVPISKEDGVSEIVSKAITRDADTFRHFRKSKALTIHLENDTYTFSTDTSLIFCLELTWECPPQDFVRLICESLEVVERDAIVSLFIETGYLDVAKEILETLLRGLPRLERIKYRRNGRMICDIIDPFVLVFSQPFIGEPVCPELRDLELSKGVLAHLSTASLFKRALSERKAYSTRSIRLGLSDKEMEEDLLVLAPFQNLAD